MNSHIHIHIEPPARPADPLSMINANATKVTQARPMRTPTHATGTDYELRTTDYDYEFEFGCGYGYRSTRSFSYGLRENVLSAALRCCAANLMRRAVQREEELIHVLQKGLGLTGGVDETHNASGV